jgi:transcriptional regulator with XRE-family HTH domain
MIYQKGIENNWDSKNLGRRLKALRGKQSQAALANLLGISQEEISRFESGNRVPGVPLLIRLAEVYRVTLDWLITGHSGEGSQSVREPSRIPDADAEILNKFRRLKTKDRTLVLSLLERLLPPTT